MKINLGGGYKKFDGYVNVDNDQNCIPDYVCDLEKDRLPFPDNCVTNVIAHHILEHIGDGYFHLLQELYRVCKHDALIDIRVPHHYHDHFFNDPTHKRPITVEGLRLFSKTFNKRDIELGSASSTLGLKYNVDFEIVKYDYIPDEFYKEIITRNSPEQNTRLFREALNAVIETHVVLKAIKE